MTPTRATHGARLPPHHADSRSDTADLLTTPILLTGRNRGKGEMEAMDMADQRRAIPKLNALFAAFESSIEPFIKEVLGDGNGRDR
jgi:hypothetical protein